MSGLRHAQKLMDSTQVQTIDRDANDADGFGQSLPNLVDPKMTSLGEDTVLSAGIGAGISSEEELLQKINLMQEVNTFTEGYTGQPKAMNRLGSMVRGTKPQAIRKAAIVDINRDTSLPAGMNRRKNKNDFYRFLLSTNQHGDGNANKINNDVFIPRSILKKSYVPGSIKEQRLEAAAEEFFEYQLAMQRMKRDSSEEYLGKYEVVFGQHLDQSDLQLSPKVKQLVQDKMELEQIFNMPADTPSPTGIKDSQPGMKAAAETVGMPDDAKNALTLENKVAQPQSDDGKQSPVAKESPGGMTGPEEPVHNTAAEAKPVEDPAPEAISSHPSESEGTRTRKIKIRQAMKDKGIFETGVEVVEHEVELDEDDEGRV